MQIDLSNRSIDLYLNYFKVKPAFILIASSKDVDRKRGQRSSSVTVGTVYVTKFYLIAFTAL